MKLSYIYILILIKIYFGHLKNPKNKKNIIILYQMYVFLLILRTSNMKTLNGRSFKSLHDTEFPVWDHYYLTLNTQFLTYVFKSFDLY